MSHQESKPADAGEDLSKMETPELVRLAWETCHRSDGRSGWWLYDVAVFQESTLWQIGTHHEIMYEGALTRWLDEKCCKVEHLKLSAPAVEKEEHTIVALANPTEKGRIVMNFGVRAPTRLRALCIACIRVQRWIESRKGGEKE